MAITASLSPACGCCTGGPRSCPPRPTSFPRSRLPPSSPSSKEPSGANQVHLGQNRGTTDVVLEVLYVLPHGAPFAEDAPNPGCTFQ